MAKKADIYFYDIESWSNLFMVTLMHKNTGKILTYFIHDSNEVGARINLYKEGTVEGFGAEPVDMDLDDLIDIFVKGDWFSGYNNVGFDDQVIGYIIEKSQYLKTRPNKEITRKIFSTVQDIIEQEDYKRYKYKDTFRSLDLMRIGNIDKSLKAVAINLKHDLIMDFPFDLGYQPTNNDIKMIVKYNVNDVLITRKLYDVLSDNIQLRHYISRKYGVDVYNYPDSGVANRLLDMMYEKASRIPKKVFRGQRTDRVNYDKNWDIDFAECVSDKVNFSTPKMQKFLEEVKDTKIAVDGSFEKKVSIGNLKYKMAKGGLHSEHEPEIYRAGEDTTIIEDDVSSYYPAIMAVDQIKPKHLHSKFNDLVTKLTDERLKAKYAGKKTESDALKIVINSIFGKLGYGNSWLYDPKAMYQVTLNGQLYLLMLIERLEEAGFEVIYANTDGVLVKVPENRRDEKAAISDAWENALGFTLDQEEFSTIIIADVNNYIWEEADGSIKAKGRLNKERHMFSWGLQRTFDRPIIPIAIEKYFFDDKPIGETLKSHDDPLDFCKAHKPGKKFSVKKKYIENGKIKEEDIQRTNRYAITNKGYTVLKYTDKKENVIPGTKGHNVTLLNSRPDQFNMSKLDYGYYRREIMKEIAPIENNQMDMTQQLFDNE